jgi:hypothetical protein
MYGTPPSNKDKQVRSPSCNLRIMSNSSAFANGCKQTGSRFKIQCSQKTDSKFKIQGSQKLIQNSRFKALRKLFESMCPNNVKA